MKDQPVGRTGRFCEQCLQPLDWTSSTPAKVGYVSPDGSLACPGGSHHKAVRIHNGRVCPT